MLLLYIEIFAKKVFRLWAYGFVAIVTAFWIGIIITILASCRPIRAKWHPEMPATYDDVCTEELAAAAISMFLDVLIVAVPLPIVWKLQMPLRKRVGVSVTFGLGLRYVNQVVYCA